MVFPFLGAYVDFSRQPIHLGKSGIADCCAQCRARKLPKGFGSSAADFECNNNQGSDPNFADARHAATTSRGAGEIGL